MYESISKKKIKDYTFDGSSIITRGKLLDTARNSIVVLGPMIYLLSYPITRVQSLFSMSSVYSATTVSLPLLNDTYYKVYVELHKSDTCCLRSILAKLIIAGETLNTKTP